MKKYEEPKITFSEFRLDQSIADACQSLKGENKPNGEPGNNGYSGPFTYDISGEGYVSFWVKSKDGNCKSGPDAFNIIYHGSKIGEDGTPLDGKNVEGTAMEIELEAALSLAGGSNGQPYHDLPIDFPVNPDPSWSL